MCWTSLQLIGLAFCDLWNMLRKLCCQELRFACCTHLHRPSPDAPASGGSNAPGPCLSPAVHSTDGVWLQLVKGTGVTCFHWPFEQTWCMHCPASLAHQRV